MKHTYLLLIPLLAVSCTLDSQKTVIKEAPPAEADYVMPDAEEMDAIGIILAVDTVSSKLIPTIDMYDDQAERQYVVGKVKHGDKVAVLTRKEDMVLVLNSRGEKGWISYKFIKHMRDADS